MLFLGRIRCLSYLQFDKKSSALIKYCQNALKIKNKSQIKAENILVCRKFIITGSSYSLQDLRNKIV